MVMRTIQTGLVPVFLCLVVGCASLGCERYVGVSVHPERLDKPEFYAPNPIGLVGAECRRDDLSAYLEHRSSIPYLERGYGLNEVGGKLYW